MRIYYERSGGFAGLRQEITLDSQSIDAEEAGELQKLVEQAGFFDLPARITAPGTGADQFQYRITVESGPRRHTVEAGEASIPAALQPLLDRLAALARTKRQS